jgi:hypothetical protein
MKEVHKFNSLSSSYLLTILHPASTLMTELTFLMNNSILSLRRNNNSIILKEIILLTGVQ